MKRLAVRSAASLAAAFPFAAAAETPGLAAPTAVIAGFRSTCLGSFPDLDRAASLASADRWTEQKAAAPGRKRRTPLSNAPRMFEKDGVTLVLAKPDAKIPGTTVACLVTGMADHAPDVRSYAATVATSLGLGAPTWSGKRAMQTAFWTLAAGTVRASVARYRDTRSYSLQISR